MLRLLGPKSRARLTADAERAVELSGRRRVGPEELLAVAWTTPPYRIEALSEVSRDGDAAVVEARGVGGQRARFDCVRENGAWRVEPP